MSWTYQQASGCFTDPNGAIQAVAYSGNGPDKNNPASEALEGHGPIVRGLWTAVSVIAEHPHLGPFVIVLEPDDETRAKVLAYGRDPDSFRIHGERVNPPYGEASDGCIVTSRDIRQLFWQSGDREVLVTE